MSHHAIDPVVIVEIDFDNGTRRYSFSGVVSKEASFYEPKIKSIGSISRQTSIIPKPYTIANTRITFIDTDNEFTQLKAQTPFRNREVRIKFGDISQGIVGLTTIYTGRISNWDAERDLFNLDIRDITFDNLRLPLTRRLNSIDFPNLPDRNELRLIPIIYGDVHSDNDTNTGGVPCYRIDGRFEDFPQIGSTNTSVRSTTGTSHVVSLPPNIFEGDLLIIFFTDAGNSVSTITTPSGWTQLFSEDFDGQGHGIGYYRIADGNEGATVTITSSTSQNSAHVTYRIRQGTYKGVPEANSTKLLSDANPDPPSLTPSWGSAKTLWLAYAGSSAPRNVSSNPADYSEQVTAVSGSVTSSSHVRTTVTSRDEETATENPGSYTLDGNASWFSATVAVEPVDPQPARYIVARHVCKAVDKVFVYGERVTENFTVNTDFVGGTEMQFIDFSVDPLDPSRPTETEVTADVRGKTDDGTSSGNLITNPAKQLRDYLINYAIIAPSRIDSEDAEQKAEDNDYIGAVWIGEAGTDHLTVAENFTQTFVMPLISSREGLLKIALLTPDDFFNPETASFQVSDDTEVLANSFKILSNRDVASALEYGYFKRWTSASDQVPFGRFPTQDTADEDEKLNQIITVSTELPYLRDDKTAHTAIATQLLVTTENQQYVKFELPITLFEADLFDFIDITHFKGVQQPLGYNRTPFILLDIDLQIQARSAKLHCRAARLLDENPHGDSHVDAHSDTSHADTHGDAAHSDAGHSDSHGDTTHSDTPHSDTHSDVAHSDGDHQDTHGDAAHCDDPHGDTAHEDVPHADGTIGTHSDSHGDVAHGDSHGDVAHSDAGHQDQHDDEHTDHFDNFYEDTPHEDVHWDQPHGDVAHSDSHGDTAHSDSHGDHADAPHDDIPHEDVTHSDSPHCDDEHTDTHEDAAHGDTSHSDTHSDVKHSDAHSDSHGDAGHGDSPHSDSHGDTGHQDTLHFDFHTDSETAEDGEHFDLFHNDHSDS